MVRAFRKQRAVALVTVAAIVLLGIQPALAAGRQGLAAGAADRPTWSAQLFDKDGNAVSIPQPGAHSSEKTPYAPTDAELQQLRNELNGLRFGLDVRAAARAERALKLLDVATAPTATERHARVLQLGVTFTERPSADGREGTIKTFVAGGKPRIQIFVAARQMITAPPNPSDVVTGGPSAATDMTGRWKIGSGCYWDENDSGPDQCSPNSGRWKTGNDGCYFDANDSGPDQCQAAQSGGGGGDTGGYTCTYQGNPADCATQQAYDDLVALIAQSEADYDAAETDYNAAVAELAAYCNSHPGECGDEAVSGPSLAKESCAGEALGAVAGLAWGLSEIVGAAGVVGGPAVALSGIVIASTTLGVIAGMAGLLAGTVLYIQCKDRQVGKDPVALPFERRQFGY